MSSDATPPGRARATRTRVVAAVCGTLVFLCVATFSVETAAAQGAPGAGEAAGKTVTVVRITATAVISGRVVSTSTGTPIRGAEVRLQSTDGRDTRLANTDEQGRFELRDLTPGGWSLRASKAGFVPQQSGQNHPLEAATVIQIANGQRVTADVSLMRGAAIGGRVLDESGEPLPGVRVQALRSRTVRGQRQLAPAGSVDESDDTGAFRVYGLPAGEYYLGVALPELEDPLIRGGNVPVYYPGTRSISQAQRITVGPGDEQPGLVVTAPSRVDGVSVSGTAMMSNGAPAARASVHMFGADDILVGTPSKGLFADADRNGRFTVPNVPPGNYVLEVSLVVDGPASLEYALLPLTIGSEPVSRLTVTTRRATTLTGTVVAEAGSPLPPRVSVLAESAAGSRVWSNSMRLNMDSSARRGGVPFSLPGVSGRLLLSVTDLPDGWMLKTVEINGNDVTDTVIDVNNYGSSAEIRIVVSERAAELTGRVESSTGARAASVVVFSDDPTLWTYPARFVRAARTDAEGGFRISGLPPGRYRAVAVSYLEEDEFQNPEFLLTLQPSGTAVSFREGEKKTVTLTLMTR